MNDIKNNELRYKNSFIDEVVIKFDKRVLILLFHLISRFQKEKIIEIELSELRELVDLTRKTFGETNQIVEKLYDQKIFYKDENNEYIKDHLFDKLILSNDKKVLKFEIKEKYKDYFVNLKNNFSTISIDNLKQLNQTQILLYLYLNRWKTYDGIVESDWEIFRINMGFTEGYKNNHIINKLNNAIEKIKKEIGMSVKYELIRSKNKREILKVRFSINEEYKKLKEMLKSSNELERKWAKIALKKLEKNKWKDEE